MNKPTPVRGNAKIISEQSRALSEYQRALMAERADNARLANVLARALDDMKHHACVTDDTLRIMQRVHSEIMEEGK